MNKPIFIVCTLLGAAVASAAYLAIELQQERERADSLALRAFEHEPVEKGGAASSLANTSELPHEPIDPSAERNRLEDPPAPPEMSPQRSVLEFPGSLRSRQRVARLQSRLSDGTPMQDYQIRALIAAFDDLERSPQESNQPYDAGHAGSEHLIQAASDILFESQMEEFVEMLREGDSG